MVPSVSVIIPTFKRSDYLQEAIESVLIQDYENLEIIVVDDNAQYLEHREGTKEVIKSYQDAGMLVKAVFPDKNLGGALARNFGVVSSDADYIAFLDDDDYFFQGKISSCVKALENEAVDFVYNFVIDTNQREYKESYQHPLVDLFRIGCLFATSQLFIRRERFLAVGGFDDSPAKQDAILTFKLLNEGYNMGVVPQIFNYYRHHNQGRISSRRKTFEGEENLRKKYDLVKSKFSHQERREIEVSMYTRLLKRGIQVKNVKGVIKYIFLGLFSHHRFFVSRLLSEWKQYHHQKS